MLMRKRLKDAFVLALGIAIFSLCFVFVKSIRDDAKESARILAINEIIHCGIEKMATKAKEQVALSEYQRKIARLEGDEQRAVAEEAAIRPIFTVLVDSCAPVDREQRREAIGWFKYALAHNEEYREIDAPHIRNYQQAVAIKAATKINIAKNADENNLENIAWVFKK
jgi:hypothetical protein